MSAKAPDYRARARAAIQDGTLQKALGGVQQRLGPATAALYAQLPEGPGLRQTAHDLRMQAVMNLDLLLEALADKVRAAGGHVYFAADAQAATDYCLQVARDHKVRRVVKGKSMVTEEIALNRALEAAGIEAVETDLGEYIIQLAGERPSHIIAPAIHKTRQQVGRLFAEKLGIPYTEDPPRLTQAARKALRAKFLAADMGISGCNLAIAETGHITTVSNEGNIRMATTLPRVHVAIMGMERIVARLQDHQILLRLLSHGAAAQKVGGYVSFIAAAATPDQADGPEAFHLVVLDNGRSRILADEDLREILCCLRCGACLNVCPVYGKIGGHAYGTVYTGPVGAVLSPLLAGLKEGRDLCLGETLCGACQQACPVNINLPRLLLALRQKMTEGDRSWGVPAAGGRERAAMRAWSWVVASRGRYETLCRLLAALQRCLPRKAGWIRWAPLDFRGWTFSRDLKPLARERFVERWRRTKKITGGRS